MKRFVEWMGYLVLEHALAGWLLPVCAVDAAVHLCFLDEEMNRGLLMEIMGLVLNGAIAWALANGVL